MQPGQMFVSCTFVRIGNWQLAIDDQLKKSLVSRKWVKEMQNALN
jgi:hypothetical protein